MMNTPFDVPPRRKVAGIGFRVRVRFIDAVPYVLEAVGVLDALRRTDARIITLSWFEQSLLLAKFDIIDINAYTVRVVLRSKGGKVAA